ncbi:hypothetical protein L596_013218 [Steinernema carpocapsae]|uniref:Uncharacterized protein n=1 Tax=Steinernema carpocapsae TaxID=34508 RepID=A0A4U5NZH3_STECR|nr:hypothetical protein L596_013218 [Steinernema carpocapsae]
MADCLEADNASGADHDRSIDSSSFQREQFDLFKHDFRESAEALGENSNPMTLSAQTKKDIVNVVRTLQKAQFFLDSIPAEVGSELAAQIGSTAADLKAFLVGKGSLDGEFTAQNVNLPEYVHFDLSMLMGGDSEDLSPEAGTLDGITALDRVTKAKIDSLLGAASILLLEYNDLKKKIQSQARA